MSVKILHKLFKNAWAMLTLAGFFLSSVLGPLPLAHADEFYLPAPGAMVRLSVPLDPPILKGIKVHTQNPFTFDFILDKGGGQTSEAYLKDESSKLIKYFLTSLTVPETDLWVNLSPYERDRIIPQSFGLTEMGRDLLAEDYLLKQITASVIYPEDQLGKKFWNRIYEQAAAKFGTTDIPVNTFNKVWIVPDSAVVYENAGAATAYVVESRLRVMLEEDYVSLQKHAANQTTRLSATARDVASVGANIVREIVIPALTREVNTGKNFSKLRQVYNSLILAAWYKRKIKDSILSQVYADRNKVDGVQYTSTVIPLKAGIRSRNDIEGVYQEYLKAFKKGVYSYIKEEVDPVTRETIPRRYFSGGLNLAMTTVNAGQKLRITTDRSILLGKLVSAQHVLEVTADLAMTSSNRKIYDDWHVTFPEVSFKVSELQEAKLKRLNAGQLFIDGFLRQNSRQEIERVFSRIARRPVSFDDLTKEIIISSDEVGRRKVVFKIIVRTRDGLDVKLALKKEIKPGTISQDETTFLELLSQSPASDVIPRYGGRYHGHGQDFYLEEFIEGKELKDLKAEGRLTDDIRKKAVTVILTVAQQMGVLPADVHYGNIIEQNGAATHHPLILVDLGNSYVGLGSGLLKLISYYGHYGDDAGSNDFIFQSFIDVFGLKEGLGYLAQNLANFDQGLEKEVSIKPAYKEQISKQVHADLERFVRQATVRRIGQLSKEFAGIKERGTKDHAMATAPGQEKPLSQRISDLLAPLPKTMSPSDVQVEAGRLLSQNGINLKLESVLDSQSKDLFAEDFTRFYVFGPNAAGTRLIAVSNKNGQMEARFRQLRMQSREVREPKDAGIPAIIERIHEDIDKINKQLGAVVIDSGWVFGPWADGDWEHGLSGVDVLLRVNSPNFLQANVSGLADALGRVRLFDKQAGTIPGFNYHLYFSPRKDATFLADGGTKYSANGIDARAVRSVFSINETARRNSERSSRLGAYIRSNYQRLQGSRLFAVMVAFSRILEDKRNVNKSDEHLRFLLEGVAARQYLGKADLEQFRLKGAKDWESVKKSFNEIFGSQGEYSLSFPATIAAPVLPSREPGNADRAMKGGIDFNTGLINLQLQNAGRDIRLHIDPTMLHQLQNAPGFVPVIISIQPVRDLKVFLGVV